MYFYVPNAYVGRNLRGFRCRIFELKTGWIFIEFFTIFLPAKIPINDIDPSIFIAACRIAGGGWKPVFTGWEVLLNASKNPYSEVSRNMPKPGRFRETLYG
jgi:hypothetical protein